MTGTLEFPVPGRTSRRRNPVPVPVTVAVGHRSALVTAGLAATLARTPGCHIRLSKIPPSRCGSDCPQSAQLIFGDSALLKHLRESADLPEARSLANAKFIWVTAGDEPSARAAKAAGRIDEHVPLECPEEELFALVRRLVGCDTPAARARARVRGGLAPGAFRRVREYIDEHVTDKITTGALANVATLSLGHFNRAFRQTTGRSPHRYVLERRIAAATDLLCRTRRALADIALDVGFADQSHFSRTYAAMTGETPSQCRRRHR
jgi:AraC-like DNA-binding protein